MEYKNSLGLGDSMEELNSLDLFQCLEHATIQIKFWHQQTTFYSEHMALGTFYEGISDLSDNLVEVYMGAHQRTNGEFGLRFKPYSEGCSMKYMEGFCKKIMSYYEQIEESYIKNLLDEVMALTAKTKYLLTLKH